LELGYQSPLLTKKGTNGKDDIKYVFNNYCMWLVL
jgi:hypothetical protein